MSFLSSADRDFLLCSFGFQLLDRCFLSLDFFVLLEELVEQHRIDLIVTDCVGFHRPYRAPPDQDLLRSTSSAIRPNCGISMASLL